MSPSKEDSKSSAGLIVDQNLEAIMALHESENLALPRHQRTVEKILVSLTVPSTVFVLVIAIALWIGLNVGLRVSGHTPFDKPPFGWLQMVVSVIALVLTSLIIITQSRQGKVAERNAHLDLQVNLLVDQKVTKIIQLLEEMRKDSPQLPNRRDLEAEELQVAVDPVQVATVITERMSTDAYAEIPELHP